MKYSREWAEEQHDKGKKSKYLLFWGHRKHPDGEITRSCFSQWWVAPFEVEGITYPTAEHWMMAEKARLFNDAEVLEKILTAESPAKAKKLGRQVKGFHGDAWNAKRIDIVVQGNLHKFRQNAPEKAFLLGTGQRILVEASPVDTIWGIGLDVSSQMAKTPPKWRGLNLLGFALMEVRDILMSE